MDKPMKYLSSFLCLIFLLTLGCFHLDSAVKSHYTVNKLFLWTSAIESFHTSNGHYPDNLDPVVPIVKDYLHKHPEVTKNYFCTPWTNHKFKMLENGFQRPMHYVKLTGGDGYYLFTSCISNEVPIKTLLEIRQGKIDSCIYATYNGNFFSGAYRNIQGVNINKSNLSELLIPINYRGHIIND